MVPGSLEVVSMGQTYKRLLSVVCPTDIYSLTTLPAIQYAVPKEYAQSKSQE